MKPFRLLFILLVLSSFLFAQDEDVDVFIIDAYVTPETPYKIKLTFFTSEPAKSKLILNDKYKFTVSNEYNEDHVFEMEISGYKFDSSSVPFYIDVLTKDGTKARSEIYDLSLPGDYEISDVEGSGILTVCCFGGVIFGMPSPSVAIFGDDSYFSLSKAIPVVSIYSGGYNYPVGIISLEYSHIFDGPRKNFLRTGYNRVFQPGGIEYISPGLHGFTDFLGYNGISAEMSIGLFKVYNVFTVYTKYRYNFDMSKTELNFQEVSIGLYSSFFSIGL